MDYIKIVERLAMEPIPEEGGWFSRQYTSPLKIDGRASATSIYALFTNEQFSALHRLDADELFFYQSGNPFEVLELLPNGDSRVVVIGPDIEKGHRAQFTFSKGSWFGGRPISSTEFDFSLVSCMVTPGFIYEGFELGEKDYLVTKYPKEMESIFQLTRSR